MRVLAPFSAALASLALATAPVGADVVVLTTDRDSTLYEPEDEKANGGGSYIFAGRTDGGDRRRAVLYFDIAGSIPAGATINSVALQLYMSRTKAGNRTVTLHRATSDWGEGTSNASGEEGAPENAEQNDATWAYTFYDTNDPSSSPQWGSRGGDFDAGSSASQTVGGNGFYTWSSATLAGDVQDWLDDTLANYGWFVLGDEGASKTAKRFNSRQSSNTSRFPELTVDFTPPVLAGACCDPTGTCGVTNDASTCTGQGGTWHGSGSACTPNPCPPPVGACCLPVAAATCTEDTETSCTGLSGTWQGALTTCAATQCPVVLTPYLDPLPIPAVAQPLTGSSGGAAHYAMAMREIQQQLHSELPASTVWGFGDGPTGATYPGPTIEASVNQRVSVDWINDLRDTSATGSPLRTSHYLTVDTCPHGAALFDDGHAVVHLHGAHTADEWDGHPEDAYPPGQQLTFEYPNDQLPSTLWYHDHTLGLTRLNVYMGLAGFYLVRDAVEQALNLPSGAYEIPLAIQDRTFNPDGSLHYPAVWQDMFLGDHVLVNGKVWPFLNVDQGKYRFRLLGGSSSRTYTLALSNGASFQQIGAEGGLLTAPVTLSQVTLGPGERADVVIDFAPYAPGAVIDLVNSAPAPFPGVPGFGVVPEVMRFVVQNAPGHTAAVPSTLRSMEVLQEIDATVSREFHLLKVTGLDQCSPFEWVIRSIGPGGQVLGQKWDDISEFPALGSTEIWEFVNLSGMTHPMHIHLVMFQVLDRQAFDNQGTATNPVIVPIGSPVPPAPGEAGWKDTVQVGPNEIVRVIARFTNPLDVTGPTYVGDFPYHCHILEHEDHEMMRQFVSTTTCGDAVPGLPQEECDDGNTTPGDGCYSNCQLEDEISLFGNAQGGAVDVTLDGVLVSVSTTAGQTAAQVASAVAAAITNDATLAGAGISAVASGRRIITNGTIESVNITDPGLSQAPAVPALPGWVLAGLAAMLAATGLWALHRRSLARGL